MLDYRYAVSCFYSRNRGNGPQIICKVSIIKNWGIGRQAPKYLFVRVDWYWLLTDFWRVFVTIFFASIQTIHFHESVGTLMNSRKWAVLCERSYERKYWEQCEVLDCEDEFEYEKAFPKPSIVSLFANQADICQTVDRVSRVYCRKLNLWFPIFPSIAIWLVQLDSLVYMISLFILPVCDALFFFFILDPWTRPNLNPPHDPRPDLRSPDRGPWW